MTTTPHRQAADLVAAAPLTALMAVLCVDNRILFRSAPQRRAEPVTSASVNGFAVPVVDLDAATFGQLDRGREHPHDRSRCNPPAPLVKRRPRPFAQHHRRKTATDDGLGGFIRDWDEF